ncbi:MAG: hypothetical protein AB4050_05535 [Synechococcus sp.]
MTWRAPLDRVRPLLQMPVVSLAVLGMAWMGCAFSAPIAVWVVSGALFIYLLWSGRGGIVPAITWISLLILLILVADVRPEIWQEVRPYRYWARIVFAMWMVGVGIVCFLSQHGDLCARYPQGLCKRLRLLSAIGMCVGFFMGTLLFDAEG